MLSGAFFYDHHHHPAKLQNNINIPLQIFFGILNIVIGKTEMA
jgi:uncharacterized membrane protein